MSLALWWLFVLAAAALIVIPGPTTLLITAYTLSSGLGVAFLAMLGVCLADFTNIALSTLGLSVVFKTFPLLYLAIKWLGILYLFYLGWGLITAQPKATTADALPQQVNLWQVAAKAYTVTLLNPKGVLFFGMFLPQFIDPHTNIYLQMFILAGTFSTIGLVVMWAYALGAQKFKQLSGGNMQIFNKVGGVLMVLAGLVVGFLH